MLRSKIQNQELASDKSIISILRRFLYFRVGYFGSNWKKQSCERKADDTYVFFSLTAWLCASHQKIPCYGVCVTGDLSLESGSFERDKLFPSSFRIIFEETVISVASAEAREGLGADSMNRVENTLFDVRIVLF